MTAPDNTTHASAAAHRPFNEAVIDCPLTGVRLVEASAGTGKTFQIQTLFLRLVVLEGITVDRILVVTFTEAATKELRDRLRSILVKARGHLDGVPLEAADNDFPRVTDILAGAGDEAEQLQRLRAAVRDFDQAAIFTLHGFCARVLGEAAFECGLPFDTELATNSEGLMTQVVEDEFRTQVYTMPRLLAAAEVSKDVNFDTIGSLVKGAVGKPDQKIEPTAAQAPCDLIGALETLQNELDAKGDAIAETITAALETEFSGAQTAGEFAADWGRFNTELAAGTDSADLAVFLKRFSTSGFEKDTKRGVGCETPASLQAVIDASTTFTSWLADNNVKASRGKWQFSDDVTVADVNLQLIPLLASLQESVTAAIDFVVEHSEKFEKDGIALKDRLYLLQTNAEATPESFPATAKLTKTLAFLNSKNVDKVKSKEEVHWQLPPEIARFAGLCDEVRQQLPRALTELKRNLIDGGCERFRALKAEQNLRTYDDMLLDLRDALDPEQTPGAEALAELLRDKFEVGVIDEFQDTDPVQFKIFSRIFIDGSKPLFLVGDPKQAIYAFRNADIFTYFHAKKQVVGDCRYTLLQNYRSEPLLIEAVNHLFREPEDMADGDMSRSFAMPADRIRYNASRSAGKEPEDCLQVDGETDPAPLKLQILGKIGNKDAATEIVHERVAADIDDLLKDKQVTMPDRRADGTVVRRAVQPGDIAVLVLKHKQAHGLKEKLLARRIPAVLQSAGKLFDANEAKDMRLVLKAIGNPTDFQSIRAALASPLFAIDGARLATFPETGVDAGDAGPSDADILNAFQEAHKTWAKGSFIGAFNTLSNRTGMRQHLLSLANGERAVTNVLHVAEVLQQVSRERKLGMAGLTNWMHRQVDGASHDAGSETEIRLESDDDAVKVITVFKAKGLEFPIVFAPYMWSIKVSARNPVSYHRESTVAGAAHDLVLDLEPAPPAPDIAAPDTAPPQLAPAELAEAEALAEHLRLLYVALTRGVHRTYLICGLFGDEASQKNALNYLLTTFEAADAGTRALDLIQLDNLAGAINKSHDAWRETNPEPAQFPIEVVDETGDSDSSTEAADTVAEPGTPETAPEPSGEPAADSETPSLTAAELGCHVDKSWAVMSFSSLSPEYRKQQATFDDEEFDRDRDAADAASADTGNIPDSDAVEEGAGAPPLIFSFPGGRKAGNCWHAIFENLDFQAPSDIVEAEVRRQVDRFGIVTGGSGREREDQRLAVLDMVEKVLRTPLPVHPETPDESATFQLSSIPWADRVAELQFMFGLPDAGLRTIQLRDVLAAHWERFEQFEDALASWDRTQWAGVLTGFIDLVAYHAATDRYYIVDWKSNILEATLESFTDERIAEEMKTHAYFLQYLFYTVALHQYLSQVVPGYDYDDHFGGVFYLFLRGIDGSTRRAVYADRPARALVEALSTQLGDFSNHREGTP